MGPVPASPTSSFSRDVSSPVLERGMKTLSRSLQVPVTAGQLELGIRSSIVDSMTRGPEPVHRRGMSSPGPTKAVVGSKHEPIASGGDSGEPAPGGIARSVSAGAPGVGGYDRLSRLRGRLSRFLYCCAAAFRCRYCQGMNYLAAMLLVQCDADAAQTGGTGIDIDSGGGDYATRHPLSAGDSDSGTINAPAPISEPEKLLSQFQGDDTSLPPVSPGEVLAFNIMRQLFDQRGMQGLFARDMQAVGALLFALEQVLWKVLPEAQAAMKRAGVSPAMFATGWVMTLMSNERAIPAGLAPRVWDAFLVGGWPEVLRAVAAIVAVLEPRITGHDIAEPSMRGDHGSGEGPAPVSGSPDTGAVGSASRTDDDAMG